jgi:UDP-N-acetyl-D-mannosaminuronic acid dehydrogenase
MNNKTYNRVSVVGMGYIGLPTAAAMAGKGIEVMGCDINPEIVDIINQGKVHIIEPDLDELVKKVVSEKKLQVFTTPQAADVYMVVVPTPFKQNHQPDISFVEQATRSVIPLLKPEDLFIVESTKRATAFYGRFVNGK